MITLFQYPSSYGADISVSPYCAKFELYLRLTARDYKTEKANPLKSPNKAVPYVRWEDGTIEAESDQLIGRLEAQGPSLDEGLTDADKARAAELQKLAEGVLYYACVYHRFADPDTWPIQRKTVLQLVPWLLSPILTRVIRRSQIKKCAAHGFVTDADYSKAVDAAQQLSDALGDNDYMLGNAPRTVDCAVWANLASCASTSTKGAARDAIRADDRLMAYIRRLASRADLALPV